MIDCSFWNFSQFETAWDWLGWLTDIFGIIALGITLVQIWQVKNKVNSSINAMSELKRLQEQEILKKAFVDLSRQQENIYWLLNKYGQSGFRTSTFEEKNTEIISTINHCLNELLSKHTQISKPLRLAVLELRKYNGTDKKPLEEAEGYLYSALQAVKAADEECAKANENMIAHSN